MTDRELLSLLHSVEKELSRRSRRRKKDAVSELRRVAKEAGFNLEELIEVAKTARGSTSTKKAASKGTRKKAKIKYRDPDNKENTWAGRGRKPLWLEAALKAGKKMEDFAV